MNDLTFDNLNRLHLLWLVVGVAALGVYGVWQRRRALRHFATAGLLPRLARPIAWPRALLRLALCSAALSMLVVALLGPRWGEIEQRAFRRGIDVMVLLDVSRSMLARDVAPSRLQRAVVAIRDDLLPALGGDRVGVVAFAGLPRLKCPLTNDYGFVRLVLEDVGVESSPRGGSLIGDAIRQADKSFSDTLDTQRIVLLITDGEDQESFPVDAARDLWERRKIPVVSVALGDEREGARIPIGNGQNLQYQGQEVWSRARFDDLRRIASLSPQHAFLAVGTRDFDLGAIYRDRIVPSLRIQQREERERERRPARAHLFALGALALLVFDSFLRDGVRLRELRAAPARVIERAA